MKGKNISLASSVLIVISSLLIISALFLPWWKMDFWAPQYPEGLEIIVYPNKLDGDIANINSLNHYIGMNEFSEETFPELQFMPFLVIGLAILVLLAAFIGRKAYIYTIIGLFIIGGAVGVWDMRRWLVDFGTNLDPMAPIDMDPFVPPIIGENIIANFTTYSSLQIGAYLIVIAFILILIPIWKDRKK